LALGNFAQGWPAYEYRWVNPPSYNQQLKHYLARNDTLAGKTVLLKTEYGLGDTLQFIRYAQKLKNKGATIIVESQKPLVQLLSLCPYIDTVIPAGGPLPNCNFTALLMSLPLIFDTTLETVPAHTPYLYADQQLTTYWQQQLSQDNKLKIGICWQADPHKNSNDTVAQKDAKKKSIPLNLLAQLSTLENVSLYSLQKINGLEQLAQLPDIYTVHDFGSTIDEQHGPFMDIVAIIKNLDLVITIDTAIAHLAGGLGVPVWVVLPHTADWRWLLQRNNSPWYPTMQLFRQQSPDNWQDVITTIRALL